MENTDNVPQKNSVDITPSTYYPSFSRKFVCVQYPAIVNNVDRAIETLGGVSSLEAAVGNPFKKLELRFNPKNAYCKPCIADRDYKSGVLLKVKIRRPKNSLDEASSSKASTSDNATIVGYEVMGVTAMNFKFNRLCDFQYLPVVPVEGENEDKETPLVYIQDKILPQKLPDKTWLFSEESKTMTCFLPPSIFSRFNTSNNKLEFDKTDIYNSTMRPELGEQLMQFERRSESRRSRALEVEDVPQNASIIHNSRRSRKAFSSTVNFNNFEVPEQPNERVLSLLRLDIIKDASVARIKELFNERPIWSKIAIAYKSGVPYRNLKFILPSVAYYFINGPWRVMWVRYGYDPRKDPSSRIYQTFDFRLREVDTTVLRRRGGKNTTRAPKTVQKFSLKDNIQKRNTDSPEITESCFILKPGIIPSGRQMFYQFCDVLLPEVQNMLARLPEIPPGQPCDPKTGWLPDHFREQCREIANKYVQEEARKMLVEEREKMRTLQADETANVTQQEDVTDTSDNIEKIVIDGDSDVETDLEDRDDESVIEDDEEWNSVDEVDGNDNDDDDVPMVDMDAVEEVNRLLEYSQNQKQENVDVDTESIEQLFAGMFQK